MSDLEITPEMRNHMRERVMAFERELRLDQSFAQPSQIIDREAVPIQIGAYTDEQIDRIIRIMAGLKSPLAPEDDDALLSRALQRFNIGS